MTANERGGHGDVYSHKWIDANDAEQVTKVVLTSVDRANARERPQAVSNPELSKAVSTDTKETVTVAKSSGEPR